MYTPTVSLRLLFNSDEFFCYRLDQLTEASSLAEDFQSMQRDLRSSFSEIQCKLNAVDLAPADNVEAMQNQLHEAKVSLCFVSSNTFSRLLFSPSFVCFEKECRITQS